MASLGLKDVALTGLESADEGRNLGLTFLTDTESLAALSNPSPRHVLHRSIQCGLAVIPQWPTLQPTAATSLLASHHLSDLRPARAAAQVQKARRRSARLRHSHPS